MNTKVDFKQIKHDLETGVMISRVDAMAMADAGIAMEHAAAGVAVQAEYRCADCKTPLQAGYTCDKCGSFEAEENEPAAPAVAPPVNVDDDRVSAAREARRVYLNLG